MRERREDCMVCKWVVVACTHSLLFTASWLPYARLQRQSNLPSRYLSSIRKSDEQRERLEQIRRIKEAKTTKAKEVYNFILQHTTHTSEYSHSIGDLHRKTDRKRRRRRGEGSNNWWSWWNRSSCSSRRREMKSVPSKRWQRYWLMKSNTGK